MPSIYQLKPAFQNLLRPLVTGLFKAGVTANQVTLMAMFVSVALGAFLYFFHLSAGKPTVWLLLFPLWMLVRMAFNAIDGMLAREFGQKSKLGALLNELTDVLADAALYAPFALIAPLQAVGVGAVIVLAGLTEFAGALGPTIGATRRYDGPLGKSDRAFVFGALGLWVALSATLPGWLAWLMPLLVGLSIWTLVNRMRRALAEAT